MGISGNGVFPEDVKLFDDNDPVKLVLNIGTCELSNLDHGTVTIHISCKHGLRHECDMCVRSWMSTNRLLRRTNPPLLWACVHLCAFQFHRWSAEMRHLQKSQVSACSWKTHLHQTVETRCFGKTLYKYREEHSRYMQGRILNSLWYPGGNCTERMEPQDLSGVTTLYIDEIQSTHGQHYMIMVADQNHRAICGVTGLISYRYVMSKTVSNPKGAMWTRSNMSAPICQQRTNPVLRNVFRMRSSSLMCSILTNGQCGSRYGP